MAVITISNTGGNWNATGTWVGGVVPVAADSVIATATSGPLTVTANATINGVNFTNYTNTFTINSGVTLSQGAGSATSQPFTFVSGMTVAGTGTLSFNGTFTMTSGGKVWTGNLRFAPQGSGASRTITLGDNWTIEGNLEFIPGTSLTQVVNGGRNNFGTSSFYDLHDKHTLPKHLRKQQFKKFSNYKWCRECFV